MCVHSSNIMCVAVVVVVAVFVSSIETPSMHGLAGS